MAKVVTLNPINPTTFEYQDYSAQDDNLIVNFTIEPTFNPLQNYVTYFIYNLNNNVVFANEIDFEAYNIIDSQVVLNPELDVENAGYEEGQYNVVYNFLNNELSSSFFQRLYVDQISPDRTEIRLNTTQISNLDLINGANSLISRIQNNPGVYFDFFVDFGNNQLVIANNMLLDTSNPEDPTVLIKLYEPLPINFNLKDECWVVTEVANTVAYNINITQVFELVDDNIQLKGPNYNLGIKDQINNSTEYVTYSTVSSSSYATGSNNLQYQINSILAERGVEINVDYSNYNNFIYFSSALTRLENFYYKLQLIEEYNYSASLSNLAGSSAYIVTSKNIWEEKINEIITTFDGYDYYLYYSSGSTAWPKTNSIYPYNNASTNSVAGIAFIQSQSVVAGEYDENNNNILINSIPEFLRNDLANAEYELFIEMLGEMFDNIWIYYQDVTEKWNADNRLQYGVSKDIVADVLRDLGLKIYQNSFGSADLYTALLGVTPSGSDFPFPYMTGSLPTPTGFEYINSSISASNEAVPLEDIEKGTYKRLYHNLPLLLKKKGTTTGLQNLITVYGIPSTILRVAEFGGKDKDESNDWDYYKQRYNYKLDTRTNPSITTNWSLNNSWGSIDDVPNTLQFRFKLPSSGSTGAVNIAVSRPSQSLWSLDTGNTVALVLEYTGSGFTSGSYSGSTVNPYYQYANLKFTADGMASSASVYLPFFNGDWWSVMVSRTGSNYFTLYAANNIYNGDDGSTIGFIASSSYIDLGNGANWVGGVNSYFGANGNSISLGSKTYTTFSGSYQEVRYYTIGLSSSAFEDWTMNPDSIEGNYLNSSPDQLAFRASLGGELYTGSVSIHPKVTGSWIVTSSFASNSNFTTGSSRFTPNVETVYLDQPAAGIKNIVSNKIQVVDTIIASGNTTNTGSLGNNVLSQYRSIQQQPPGGSTYTENLAYTEVAFSPQNEINDDIMDQLGFFNMGEFIGDPRQRFNQDTSYPDLDALRDAYFEKYTGNYDLNDYIRLIKFFDNSLFKMIKDFTPARSSLASGVVIKQTLLERNKYPQPEVTQSLNDYSGSINTAFILGGAGGSVNKLNGLDTNPYYIANGLSNNYGLTQSWSESVITPYAAYTVVKSSQDEFYNGEYSGSEFVVENGELNEANPFKQVPTTPTNYTLDLWGAEFGTSEATFLNTVVPSAGTASFWSYDATNPSPIGGGSGPYIKWAKIHSTDLNSNNISLTLQALETLVTSYSKVRGPFIVISISPRNSGDYYVFEFAPGNTAYTFPGPPVGNVTISNQQTVFSPYITAKTGPFQNSDYNAIINNAIPNRLSQWYQQIDYATNQLVPVNFQQLISGTATPASVQDSNYTSYQYSGIRYWGSKNTTDNFNSPLTITSSIVQTYQNDNLGLTTLGYASVNKLDASILQFDWGGGTYPQIINGGILALNDMLLVGADRDAVTIFPSQQAGFLGAVSQAYPIGSYPVFNQYTTAVTTTANAQVAGYGWITPSVSNYYIPSGSFNGIYGAAIMTSSIPDELYILDFEILSINPPGLGSINSQGFETPTQATGSLNTYNTISSSLAQGEDWYISMYANLGTVASGALQPITGSSTLSQQGVYKINSVNYTPGGGVFTASLDANVNANFSSSIFGLDLSSFPAFSAFGTNATKRSAGLLMWKSAPGSYLRVNNATLSGLGKGGLVTSTPTPLITQEFTYITQTYGTNPKNQ
jgi:hypothetical protein